MLKERDNAAAPRARQSVQSVDRTLDLIEALAAAAGEVSITSLAARTGLHVSTVHRLLATLVRRGYVRQNRETARYYLGSKLAIVGEGAPRYAELRLHAREVLRELTELADETSNLVVLEEGAAVYIDQVECTQVVRLFNAVGNRVPPHCTAAGKVLLAWLPEEQRKPILDRLDLRAHTPRSATTRSAVTSALELVRRGGYALDEEEYMLGVRCIAVPVLTDGSALAALSISAPAVRLPRSRAVELLPAMRKAASDLAARLAQNRAT